MRKSVLAGIALGSLAWAAQAQADGLRYSYVQVTWAPVEIEAGFQGADLDLRGLSLAGSFAVSDELFFFSDLSDAKSRRFTLGGTEGRISVETVTAGIGYRMELFEDADFNIGVAGIRSSIRGRSGFSGTRYDNGYSLIAGLRYLPMPQLELAGSVSYVNMFYDDTVVTASALGHVNAYVALVGSYSRGSDYSGYQLGVRLSF